MSSALLIWAEISLFEYLILFQTSCQEVGIYPVLNLSLWLCECEPWLLLMITLVVLWLLELPQPLIWWSSIVALFGVHPVLWIIVRHGPHLVLQFRLWPFLALQLFSSPVLLAVAMPLLCVVVNQLTALIHGISGHWINIDSLLIVV